MPSLTPRFLVLAALLCGCTKAHQTLVECAGNAALKVLPDDPMRVTVADARDVIERVKACREAPDGGAP